MPINSDPNTKGDVGLRQDNSPVIAVNDGKVVKIGQSKQLGRYLDAPGRHRQRLHVRAPGIDPEQYPVPKRVKLTATQIAKQLSAPITPPIRRPASAGRSRPRRPALSDHGQGTPKAAAPRASGTLPAVTAGSKPPRPARAAGSQPTDQTTTIAAPLAKERLFANPLARPPTPPAGNCRSRTPRCRSRTSGLLLRRPAPRARTSTRCSR